MASIFKKDDNYVDKPNRNTFDLSFQNNLSLKFGKLIPCMCQEVLPGDSFQIKPTFGLRFLPQVFPVQTRMRAHLHFFYVRNRTIWKDWMDFIGKTKENLVVPYLEANSAANDNLFDSKYTKLFTESSIYDYFGLPTYIDSNVDPISYRLWTNRGNIKNVIFNENGITYGYKSDDPNESLVNISTTMATTEPSYTTDFQIGLRKAVYYELPVPVIVSSDSFVDGMQELVVNLSSDLSSASTIKAYAYADAYDPKSNSIIKIYVKLGSPSLSSRNIYLNNIVKYKDGSDGIVYIRKIYGTIYVEQDNSLSFANHVAASYQVKPSLNKRFPFRGLSDNTLPYGAGALQMRINALPFRAYEAVYNSFYRNAENNPFKIDGVPEYNRYVKSIDGGPQSVSDFQLFNRNWEDDAYTTAVPTPQQGNAPRVGLTGNPNEPLALRVYDQDGNISTVNLVANENGQITVAEGYSGETNTIVNALNDAVNFGITISDLRNVNSLQLWLEKNVRKGYKYRDQMLSHYGVAIDYDDLMIPEFIGGVSRDVTVNQISQTVETSDGNLGDMAGQAYVVGDGENIRHYCPEHGYIIGIVTVVPVPNYNQRIPKHFFKHDTFDYFFPEFGKIGMQPIENKEITPINSWLSRNMEETFGYQRAWYDYLANVDEVHGKFNSDFYNFLLQRKFDEVPELGESFTTVINEDLNNIFYTDSNEDKILGQIYFDIKAIRPIPLFGIPSLE